MRQKVEQKISKIIELKTLGYTHDEICKFTKSSKRTVNTVCKFYVYNPYPKIKIPDNIKETQYPGYYIKIDGTAYRIPGKYDKNVLLNEYGLITLNSHLRGNPTDKKYQYPSINVSIRDENGKFLKQKKVNIHRLVAETFIHNPNNNDSVDHIDRNKMNNHVSNLRWCSIEDNKSFWERDDEFRRKISKSNRKNSLICGIGFNDVEFAYSDNTLNYVRWVGILGKCKKDNKIICEEWKKFSNFYSWIKSQNIDETFNLYLIKGNEYSPENCILSNTNLSFILTFKKRGMYPIGVTESNKGKSKNKRYSSRTNKNGHLGMFDSMEEAHLSWQKQKIKEIESQIENEKNLKTIEILELVKNIILNDIFNQRETIKSPFVNE
jgi:hypothetical protein